MSKEQKQQTEVVEQLVLVHDPILGSRYELQEVKLIDAVELISEILTEELKKEANE